MSYRSNWIKDIIYEIILDEIGEANSNAYPWKRDSRDKYSFKAPVPKFLEIVTVDFVELTPKDIKERLPERFNGVTDIWNVGYKVAGNEYQFKSTNMKVLLRTLSTVVEIIEDFIKSEKPNGVYMFGNFKEPDTVGYGQKSSIYMAFVNKNMEKISNYVSQSYKGGFLVYKKDLIFKNEKYNRFIRINTQEPEKTEKNIEIGKHSLFQLKRYCRLMGHDSPLVEERLKKAQGLLLSKNIKPTKKQIEEILGKSLSKLFYIPN